MAKVREKLYITVPNLFRCPISMDVMRSPVSLCTGVTYDRSSIQHWLDSGHDTCPATMQVLPSKDFIPNLTLHRLIRLWLLSGEPSPDSRTSGDQLRALLRGIQTADENLAVFLSKIAEFAKLSGENPRLLATFPGFDSAIVRALARSASRIDATENAISILDSVFRENGDSAVAGEKIRRLILDAREECFVSMISVLRNGSLRSKIEAVRILEFLAGDFQSKKSIAETRSLLSLLTSVLKDGGEEINDAVLSLLAVVSVTQSAKVELVRCGLVDVLSKMLRNSSCSSTTAERCLRMLAVVATCADGRAAMAEEPSCAIAVVERVPKVPKAAAEDAVVVLWSLCCLCGNVKVRDDVAKRNGVAVILLVMQRGWEDHVRGMCVDLIKVLRGACKNPLELGSYDTKTTHIKPC
ncbi:U-box domain-containing protein 28-like [Abrus precatorius]|uniref:U-box domain-containing protein n=1 Tax=Abrus precatorius TaxID=3816 RepID=A0A8B8LUP5_ABRPR|nr:U-box domain-containing protein 28-like [Abrus precatorius]